MLQVAMAGEPAWRVSEKSKIPSLAEPVLGRSRLSFANGAGPVGHEGWATRAYDGAGRIVTPKIAAEEPGQRARVRNAVDVVRP